MEVLIGRVVGAELDTLDESLTAVHKAEYGRVEIDKILEIVSKVCDGNRSARLIDALLESGIERRRTLRPE